MITENEKLVLNRIINEHVKLTNFGKNNQIFIQKFIDLGLITISEIRNYLELSDDNYNKIINETYIKDGNIHITAFYYIRTKILKDRFADCNIAFNYFFKGATYYNYVRVDTLSNDNIKNAIQGLLTAKYGDNVVARTKIKFNKSKDSYLKFGLFDLDK